MRPNPVQLVPDKREMWTQIDTQDGGCGVGRLQAKERALGQVLPSEEPTWPAPGSDFWPPQL